jgi:hypothetical protein
MDDQRERNRSNDGRLLTPLLLMALLIACGFLFHAFAGHAPTNQSAQIPIVVKSAASG